MNVLAILKDFTFRYSCRDKQTVNLTNIELIAQHPIFIYQGDSLSLHCQIL